MIDPSDLLCRLPALLLLAPQKTRRDAREAEAAPRNEYLRGGVLKAKTTYTTKATISRARYRVSRLAVVVYRRYTFLFCNVDTLDIYDVTTDWIPS